VCRPAHSRHDGIVGIPVIIFSFTLEDQLEELTFSFRISRPPVRCRNNFQRIRANMHELFNRESRRCVQKEGKEMRKSERKERTIEENEKKTKSNPEELVARWRSDEGNRRRK